MPEIRFIARNKEYYDIFDGPKAAVEDVPAWFVEQEKYGDDVKGINKRGGFNQTVKSCAPAYDAMTAGYMFYLPCDINFEQDATNGSFNANMTSNSFEHLEFHPGVQISKMPFDKEYYEDTFILKFLTGWVPKVPDGYSLFVTHPMWRYDLPFMVLPGIIDYDSYDTGINFFALVKRGYSGLLKCGTPIGHVMPFQREEWGYTNAYMTEQEYFTAYERDRRFIENGYRKNHQSKKVWNNV